MAEKRHTIQTLEPGTPLYPTRLEGPGAPTLYTLGEADLNAMYTVAIVGTRSATAYALHAINALIDGLHKVLPSGLMIVSGLALGCDIMAHRHAVELGIPTVGVLAHGLDRIYPAAHRQFAASMVKDGTGMLLTTYPEGAAIHRNNFLDRNNIVVGLSDCVVVAESAADHGGALYTANRAAAAGKRVFAIPGRITDRYSRGCNMLIRTGVARMAESADDIIDLMGWTPGTLPFASEPVQAMNLPELDDEGTAVLNYLTSHPEATADEISRALDMQLWELNPLLTEMQLAGYLAMLPGNRFMVCAG